MAGNGAVAATEVTSPSAEELESIKSINDLDAAWINRELCFLDQLVTESKLDPTCKHSTKPQLVQKFNAIAARADHTKNLIRVLHRLAETNATPQQRLEGLVSPAWPGRPYAQAKEIPVKPRPIGTGGRHRLAETSTSNSTSEQLFEGLVSPAWPGRPYAQAKGIPVKPPRTGIGANAKAIEIPGLLKEDMPPRVSLLDQVLQETILLSPNATTLTQSPMHARQFVPKRYIDPLDYERNVSNLHETLDKVRVSNSRKSRKSKKANTIHHLASTTSRKSAQEILANTAEDKLTISNAPDKDIMDSTLNKNHQVKYL